MRSGLVMRPMQGYFVASFRDKSVNEGASIQAPTLGRRQLIYDACKRELEATVQNVSWPYPCYALLRATGKGECPAATNRSIQPYFT